MPDAHDFLLRVTAGPTYDTSTHQIVHVNKPEPVTIKSEHIHANVNVRIQNFRGLPRGSPESSPYFNHDSHKHDLYSIAFSFVLKGGDTPDASKKVNGEIENKNEEGTDEEPAPAGINGNDLLFGNDFDHPIRDRLPPGFSTAFRIVKWAVDPGLQGDVYADEPYLYGPLLSSINVFGVGEKSEKLENPGSEEKVYEEGGDDEGLDVRDDADMPEDAAGRKREYLHEHKRKEWTFENGRRYFCDFFNPYLDFNLFSLKLPGFTLPIIKYWDGQPLRYVLKHKTSDGSIDQELFVIVFTLVPREEVEKSEADSGKVGQDGEAKVDSGDKTNTRVSKADTENVGYIDEGVD